MAMFMVGMAAGMFVMILKYKGKLDDRELELAIVKSKCLMYKNRYSNLKISLHERNSRLY